MGVKNNPRFSETISDFLSMMDDARTDYTWNDAERQRMESLTQDYLHKLELEELNYKERAKIATQLAICRKERREHKDMVMALEPLVTFLESDKGRQMVNLLREALGKTRKIETYMETRKYYNRVLKGGE